jgi:hypothetical protein
MMSWMTVGRVGRWLFENRRTGRITVMQVPNAPLGVFLVARVVGALTDIALLHGIGTAALLVWAVDEIVRGVNPWRRFLGAVVLVGQLAALLRS